MAAVSFESEILICGFSLAIPDKAAITRMAANIFLNAGITVAKN